MDKLTTVPMGPLAKDEQPSIETKEEIPIEGERQEEPLIPKVKFKPILICVFSTLIIAFGGFLIWALTVPLDEGVPSPGVVVVSSQRKVIQHPVGGVVKRIHVEDGDHVQEGDVLITLDEAQPKAQFYSLRTEYFSARVLEARLIAERGEKNSIDIPDDIIQASREDERLASYITLQREILKNRRESFSYNIALIKQQIKELETFVAGLQKAQKEREEQVRILSQQERSLKALVEEGYYPKNRYLELQRTISSAMAARDDAFAQIGRAIQEIKGLQIKLESERQTYMKEIDDQLAEAHKKVESLREQYEAAKLTLERTEIRAPVSGTVMNLSIHTVGGVISPGQDIMEIVPDGSDLLIEAYVDPKHIEKVYMGLPADIRFTALQGRTTPVIEGEVVFVSPDRIVSKDGKSTYYLCKISVTPKELSKLNDKEIRPGMPAEIVIKTGKRTFWEYIVRPIIDSAGRALKER